MSEELLLSLAAVVILGIGCQWLAWRLHFPAILLLLVAGFLAGPVTGFLRPDEQFGAILFPFVSISVGVILFEGGLSLRLADLKEIGKPVRNLITIGALVSFILTALLAWLVLSLSPSLAVLLGAILVVTGPTVVIPLLRHVRPVGRVGEIARWEGIMIDPVGATLAVLVYEAMLISGDQAGGFYILGLLKTIVVGTLVGAAACGLVIILFERYWVPDFLQNPVTLMILVLAFVVSNHFQMESGLLTVTLMGILLANQKRVSVRHIVEFKENLRVLLLSSLFVLLAARISIDQLDILDWRSAIFLAGLVFLVRPASVLAASIGTRLDRREKAFLAWMAPRGIVAAAVSSVFSQRLVEAGYQGADRIAVLTFLVIVTTVALYALTARPVAKRLGLAQEHPQGVLILGAHGWARSLASCLKKEGIQVMLLDANRENVRQARKEGLPVFYGDALAEDTPDQVNLSGIGRLLALTPNDEANALACLHFAEIFGRAEVYQLSPHQGVKRQNGDPPGHLRGRLLAGENLVFEKLANLYVQGWDFRTVELSKAFDWGAFEKKYQNSSLVVAVIENADSLKIAALDRSLAPKPGQKVVAMLEQEPGKPVSPVPDSST